MKGISDQQLKALQVVFYSLMSVYVVMQIRDLKKRNDNAA